MITPRSVKNRKAFRKQEVILSEHSSSASETTSPSFAFSSSKPKSASFRKKNQPSLLQHEDDDTHHLPIIKKSSSWKQIAQSKGNRFSSTTKSSLDSFEAASSFSPSKNETNEIPLEKDIKLPSPILHTYDMPEHHDQEDNGSAGELHIFLGDDKDAVEKSSSIEEEEEEEDDEDEEEKEEEVREWELAQLQRGGVASDKHIQHAMYTLTHAHLFKVPTFPELPQFPSTQRLFLETLETWEQQLAHHERDTCVDFTPILSSLDQQLDTETQRYDQLQSFQLFLMDFLKLKSQWTSLLKQNRTVDIKELLIKQEREELWGVSPFLQVCHRFLCHPSTPVPIAVSLLEILPNLLSQLVELQVRGVPMWTPWVDRLEDLAFFQEVPKFLQSLPPLLQSPSTQALWLPQILTAAVFPVLLAEFTNTSPSPLFDHFEKIPPLLRTLRTTLSSTPCTPFETLMDHLCDHLLSFLLCLSPDAPASASSTAHCFSSSTLFSDLADLITEVKWCASPLQWAPIPSCLTSLLETSLSQQTMDTILAMLPLLLLYSRKTISAPTPFPFLSSFQKLVNASMTTGLNASDAKLLCEFLVEHEAYYEASILGKRFSL